ncbi:hypothetical protein K502DRAFT_331880 [Neoconidiobolus thromboides FSU 785]|nr:hypothetical protein K502DRAFT_331880 [Neoconidiobolus thromboides FSU 785]
MENNINYITPEEAERYRRYYAQQTNLAQEYGVHSPYQGIPEQHYNPTLYYQNPNPALYSPQKYHLYPNPVNNSSPTLSQIPLSNQHNAVHYVQSHPPPLTTSQSDYQHHGRIKINVLNNEVNINEDPTQNLINQRIQETSDEQNQIGTSSSNNEISQVSENTTTVSENQNENTPQNKVVLTPEDISLPPNVTPAKFDYPTHPAMLGMPEDLVEADTFWKKLTVRHRHASRGRKPNLFRFGLRMFEFSAAFMCLILTIVTTQVNSFKFICKYK